MLNTPDLSFSVLRGVRYTFDDQGHTIEFRGSAWSGKESVTVDTDVVSENRSFAKNSAHVFRIGDSEYRLTYSTKSALKGGWSCELCRDGELHTRYDVRFQAGKKHIGIISLVVGIAFGVAFVNLPDYFFFILPAFLVSLFVLNRFRRTLTYQVHTDN